MSATTMYTLRPIVTLTDVGPRTKTMYKMRNIHEVETAAAAGRRRRREGSRHVDAETPRDAAKMPDHVVTEQSPLPEFSELETRQEKILSQLAELKKQVSMLCNFLKQSNPNAIKKKLQSCEENIANKDSHQKAVNVSLVVNADPSRPPYSIYALQKLWKDTDIRVTSYIHSTITGPVPIIFYNNTHPTSKNIINLSLIYKKVDDLEVVIDPHNHSIAGEVNFLRYLSRLIDTHNYEKNNDIASVNATDNILDLCCRVYHQVSCDNKNETLSALHNAVKQTQWTGKSEPSIADIAAWSMIKQLSKRKVPQFLHEWYERCEKTFMDNTAAL